MAGWLLCAPKWYANIEFTQEGLIFRAPFRKTTLIPYKRIHIYPASYIHVCVEVPYIVFSTKILSNYELTHINNVPNTSEVIPIEYSRKHYEKLLKVLSPEGRAMLRAAFDEKYEQEMQQKDRQGKSRCIALFRRTQSSNSTGSYAWTDIFCLRSVITFSSNV